MIHFLHANGFPAETYNQMLMELQKYSHVGYISKVGHNPCYPVVDNWSAQVDEVIDYIKNNYSEPVIGVGHSLGGVLSYLACQKEPSLFKAVVLLDAPVFTSWKLKCIRLLKKLGLIEYVTPAKNTKFRRTNWPDYDSALQHFASKKVFKYFDQRCLEDYIRFGTKKDPEDEKISLIFDSHIEWLIYRTLPTEKLQKLPENIPRILVYGEYSKVIDDSDAKYMKKNFFFECHKLNNCGHLFPFEKPKETARLLIQTLQNNHLL